LKASLSPAFQLARPLSLYSAIVALQELRPLALQHAGAVPRLLVILDAPATRGLCLQGQVDVDIARLESARQNDQGIDASRRVQLAGLRHEGIRCASLARAQSYVSDHRLAADVSALSAAGKNVDPQHITRRYARELLGQRCLGARPFAIDQHVPSRACKAAPVIAGVEVEAGKAADHVLSRHRIERREEIGGIGLRGRRLSRLLGESWR